MYNRYEGNTGRFVRVPDAEPRPPRPVSAPAMPLGRPASGMPQGGKRPPQGTNGGRNEPLSLAGIQKALGGLIPKVLPDGLETEDLMLLLILYLMYKESGDKELLIILGAMFLL